MPICNLICPVGSGSCAWRAVLVRMGSVFARVLMIMIAVFSMRMCMGVLMHVRVAVTA